jgi:CBS domain-containing protein
MRYVVLSIVWLPVAEEKPPLRPQHRHDRRFHPHLAGFIDHRDIETRLARAARKQRERSRTDDIRPAMV